MFHFLGGGPGLAADAALGAPAPVASPDHHPDHDPDHDGAGPPARERALPAPLMGGLAALAGALIATGVLLWARNGTAVFLDVLGSGIASCL